MNENNIADSKEDLYIKIEQLERKYNKLETKYKKLSKKFDNFINYDLEKIIDKIMKDVDERINETIPPGW